MYKNIIRMNCSNYYRDSCNRPKNCYNCLRRKGYPQNLGGDGYCAHFKVIKKSSFEIIGRKALAILNAVEGRKK